MKPSDLTMILNGLEAVGRAFINANGAEFNRIIKNSSMRDLSKSIITSVEEKLSSAISYSGKSNALVNIATEVKERGTVVTESVKQYSAFVMKQNPIVSKIETPVDFEIDHPIIKEELISTTNKDDFGVEKKSYDSYPTAQVLKPVDHSKKTADVLNSESLSKSAPETYFIENPSKSASSRPRPKTHTLSKLSDRAKERRVPSTRLGRLFEYSSLAVSISLGTAAEYVQRKVLPKTEKTSEEVDLLSHTTYLSEASINKIVDSLCKMRGAALKLGQMLSLQDSAMISPQLAAVLERVRQSADFMPTSQMESVLIHELGSEWRERLLEFNSKPFAAASIGQVHEAKLLDGTNVALKIQYPGVAKSIENDISYITKMVKFWDFVPKGMFLENVMAVAKRELRREVDYVNEAKSGKRFKTLLEPFPEYLVPTVYEELCTTNILATELVYGTPVDKLENEDQDLRNQVCERLLRLCLMEIFLFRFMQTDPNWSNFLYNFDTQQIVLLDFGACNEYEPEFVDTYMKIIKGSSEQDRETVLKYSQELGFLTGFETKIMEETHIDAVMILGEAFACKKPFDFKKQNMTSRIHNLVPVMLKHRLTPPPEETYSLHRKMSGIFLLCTRLGAVIDCSRLFDEVYDEYIARKSNTSV